MDRPGRTYFVPGVRVLRLGEFRRGRDDASEIPELGPDIVDVEVTRVNSGSSQYKIQLNNWYDTLPADREGHAGRGEQVQQERLRWPRFKYNAFDLINFGMRLRIDMRYWPDPIEGLSESDRAAQRWVPMIAGPVTDIKFTFAALQGARITVSGEDDLRVLKEKIRNRVPYRNTNERAIVTDVLRRANFPLTLSPPQVPHPSFFDGSRTLSETHDEGQTSMEFLQKFGERYDLEVFIEFEDLEDPASPLMFHMEPSRSRVPPDGTLRDIHIIEQGKNLLDYTPTLKVLDQFTRVTVRGRHRVRSRPEQVQGDVTGSILNDELHRDPEQNDLPLVSGPEFRRRLYGENAETLNNQANLDEPRARAMAEAKLRRKAREFLKIEVNTIGLPRLRPGRHIEIRGMQPPFNGFFYVTQTVHRYAADGLRTKITAQRPGMPAAPYGESTNP